MLNSATAGMPSSPALPRLCLLPGDTVLLLVKGREGWAMQRGKERKGRESREDFVP